jgi:hypothetical protein
MSTSRFVVLFTFVLTLAPSAARADAWCDQLFDTLRHDFGYVPKGKCKKAFTITNKLNRRVHIYSVTPSCTICTAIKPEKEWLEPGESTVLEATIDTYHVKDFRAVAVDVVFDSPYRGQSRLNLTVNSRTDIVFSPGEVAFGVVKRGTPSTRTLDIRYAGESTWKIASAVCANPAIETELVETRRAGIYVDYQLKVTLKPDTPAGVIRDRITLEINDAYNKTIDVALHGMIQADVSLSPASLTLGSVPAGGAMTKQVLVRGVRPFKIVSIESDEGPFQIQKPEEAKQLHILTVTLPADRQPGDVAQHFTIATDMEGEPPLKLNVTAKLN